MGMAQLSDGELIGELRRRFAAIVFAGLATDDSDLTLAVGGRRLDCIAMTVQLQRHAQEAEIQ